jgi:hypothetical protein
MMATAFLGLLTIAQNGLNTKQQQNKQQENKQQPPKEDTVAYVK